MTQIIVRILSAFCLCLATTACQHAATPSSQSNPPPHPIASTPVSITPSATTTPSTTTVLRFADASADRIIGGLQTSTTRLGVLDYPLGPAIMRSRFESLWIEILRIDHAKFSDLTTAIAKTDGYDSLDDLKDALQKENHNNVTDSSDITTIYFQIQQR